MTSEVKMTLTWTDYKAALTLLDPIGPNNTWVCDPPEFLSKSSGIWRQGLPALSVVLWDELEERSVLEFVDLNMFSIETGPKMGTGVATGVCGIEGDAQVVSWAIVDIK